MAAAVRLVVVLAIVAFVVTFIATLSVIGLVIYAIVKAVELIPSPSHARFVRQRNAMTCGSGASQPVPSKYAGFCPGAKAGARGNDSFCTYHTRYEVEQQCMKAGAAGYVETSENSGKSFFSLVDSTPQCAPTSTFGGNAPQSVYYAMVV